MLKVDNISKTYGDNRILNNISFTVPEGEIYTLVGALGEGKTTLLDIITGFERPDSGEISIKGTDCLLSKEKARKLFGYVPEMFPSYPNMTAKEYMKFFGRMIDDSEDDDKIKHLTVNLLGFVGLSNVMDKRISRFNRLQKQKLSIARALLHNPKFIILDEPFLGLDVEGVREIKEILDFLHGQGRTIFMTSDNLNLSASLSTSVGIIENGSMLYGDQTHQVYENIRTNSIQLRNTGELDVREVKRRLNDGEITRQEIEEPIYDGMDHNHMTVMEELGLENTGPIPNMTHIEDTGPIPNMTHIENTGPIPNMTHIENTGPIPNMTHMEQTAHLPNVSYDNGTNYDESKMDYEMSRNGYDESELNYEMSRNGYDESELDYEMSRNGYDESELNYEMSRNGYDESELDYEISEHIYDEESLNYYTNEQVYSSDEMNYNNTVRVYDEPIEMPYDKIEQIEKTKIEDDLANRLLFEENEPYVHGEGNEEQNIIEQGTLNNKVTVNKRGIVEKRGAKGSRVVTSSSYNKKTKK